MKTGNGKENDWTDRMSFGFYMSNGFLQLKKETSIDLASAFVQKNKYPIHDSSCMRYRNNFSCIQKMACKVILWCLDVWISNKKICFFDFKSSNTENK